ncbi:MAG: hypothetical protein LBV31_02840, partial [Prevotellaceae bacterium]|nr:hypothetical protein [Prevotellaceae bacterium]
MKKIFRFLIFLPIFFASCEEEQISPIPNYPVRLELDLLGEYNTFKGSVGQQLIFVERKKETDRIGFGGILVCTISTGEYCAFDLACPVEVKADVRVRPDGLFAVCDKCGSTYDIWET